MDELILLEHGLRCLADFLGSGIGDLIGNGLNGFVQIQSGGGDDTGGFNIFTNGLLDKDGIDTMLKMKQDLTSYDSTGLVGVMCYYAKVIAGFLCLLHFAGKAYNYMVGEENWKVMPLLRPFALLMVITFWSQFCAMVRMPAGYIEGTAYSQLFAKNAEVGQKAAERWEQIDILTGRIYTKAAMVDNAMDSWESDDFLQAMISSMSVTDYNDLSQKLIAGGSWVFKAFLWGLTLVIEKLGLIFLQFSIVLIIMMQTLFMGVLYVIGPLSFGFSVLGIWKNNWATWTARYLSVSFYSVILFVALSVIYTILGYSIDQELSYLTKLVTETEDPLADWDMFYEYAGAMTGQACMFIVCVMAACGATMYVPVCSTWIVETSGASQAATGVTAGVGVVTMGASSAVRAGGAMIRGIGGTIGGGGQG